MANNKIVGTFNRREILACAAVLGTSSLTSCAFLFPRKPIPICPQSPDISFPKGPLTIDAHCHVFNGTDLQIQDFLSKVAINQGGALGAGVKLLGSVLQELAWSFAPSGNTELTELQYIKQKLQFCDEQDGETHRALLRQHAYSRGREQFQAALRRSPQFQALRERLSAGAAPLDFDEDSKAQVEAIYIIESLPEKVEEYQSIRSAQPLTAMTLKGRSVRGMIDFVLQNFQYRYVSIHDYLHTYNQPGVRVVDLMLPSMVDYDWWLAKGKSTLTSLRTQVEVMRQIAIVTGGRVHSFVPYDPLRQVAFGLGHADEDSFSLVVDAIERHGCVGVKLYPPMGFAVLGNAEVQAIKGANFWARDWLPTWTNRPDLGSLLDKAMEKLLGWCEANAVPVMAHTNLSNGALSDFEALAGSQYWDHALKAFPKLRVSFGHFGDTSPVEDGLMRARAFADLMNAGNERVGEFAYADAGYFVEVVGSKPALLSNLRQLYDETAKKGSAALANRFMYGTDWEMTLAEGSVTSYLSQFVELFSDLESRSAIQAQGLKDLSSKFFGLNAVSWIGLRRGDTTRERLESFYTSTGVSKPDWAEKVDKS